MAKSTGARCRHPRARGAIGRPFAAPRRRRNEQSPKSGSRSCVSIASARMRLLRFGRTSLLAVRRQASCGGDWGGCARGQMFEHPVLQDLRACWARRERRRSESSVARPRGAPGAGQGERDVAIIGMAGRFPARPTWRRCGSTCSMGGFGDVLHPRRTGSSRARSERAARLRKGAGILADADKFDAGSSARTRASQTLSIRAACVARAGVAALEDAGVVSERYDGLIASTRARVTIPTSSGTSCVPRAH